MINRNKILTWLALVFVVAGFCFIPIIVSSNDEPNLNTINKENIWKSDIAFDDSEFDQAYEVSHLNAFLIKINIGEYIGAIFWILLLLVSIWFSHRIAKKNKTSARCSYALIITLLSWLLLIALMVFNSWVPSSLVIIVFALSSAILAVVGAVLAVMGLVEYCRDPECKYGRIQAFGAIAISLMVITIYTSLAYIKLEKDIALTTIASNQSLIKYFNDYNFQYGFPTAAYQKIEENDARIQVAFKLTQIKPSIEFRLVADKSDIDYGLDLEVYKKQAKQALLKQHPGIKFVSERMYQMNQMAGHLIQSQVKTKEKNSLGTHWIYYKNGYFYHLKTNSVTDSADEFESKSLQLFSTFNQIDQEKVAHYRTFEGIGEHQSAALGYVLDMRKTRWRPWTSVKDTAAEADIGGFFQNEGAFFVVPYCYLGKPPPFHDVIHVFQDVMNIKPTDEKITHINETTQADISLYQFDFDRLVKQIHYYYQFKIFRAKSCDYMVSVWFKDKQRLLQHVDSIFNNFKMTQPTKFVFKEDRLSIEQKKSQAQLHNNTGLLFYNANRFEESIDPFKTATHLMPKNAVYLINLLDTLGRTNKFKEGLDVLAQIDDKHKANAEVSSWKAWFHWKLGHSDAAIQQFGILFNTGYQNDDDFITYANLLADKLQWARLDEVFKRYLGKSNNIKLIKEYADLLYLQGKYEAALNLLKPLQGKAQLDEGISLKLLKYYYALNQVDEVILLANKLIKANYLSKNVYYYKALAQYHQKKYKQAKLSFEKALDYSPNNENIRNYIHHISGLLGEGNNSLIKDEITAVVIPQILKKQLPSLKDKPKGNDYDAYYFYKIRGYQFEKNKSLKHTRYRKIKVLDSAGVTEYSTLEFDFNPLNETVYVNYLKVLDAAGKVVSRGKRANYYVTDKANNDMATYDKTLYIPVPNLQPGHTIDMAMTTQIKGKPEDFGFESFYLSSSRPILKSALYYLGDTTGIDYIDKNTQPVKKLKQGLLWLENNPPVYKWESEQSQLYTFLPYVALSDGEKNWQSLGLEYYKKIKKKIVLDAETRKVVTQIIKKPMSPSLKIQHLANFVQHALTYKAIEFGSRGVIPNTPGQTLKNKYGDCKDHAVLLQQVLQANGIQSYLVLVNNGDEVLPELPTLDQFNHMIVYVPNDQQGWYLDTTGKNVAFNEAAPVGLANTYALVLDEKKTALLKIPAYSQKSNIFRYLQRITIEDDKMMKVAQTLTLSSYASSWLRSKFKSMNKSEYTAWMQKLLSRYYNDIEVKSIAVKDLDDNAKDLVVNVTFHIKGLVHQIEENMLVNLPGFWERYYLSVGSLSHRLTPFELSYPFIFQNKTQLKLPKNYHVIFMENASQHEKTGFGDWATKTKTKAGLLTLEFKYQQTPGLYKADEYDAYAQWLNKAVESVTLERRLVAK